MGLQRHLIGAGNLLPPETPLRQAGVCRRLAAHFNYAIEVSLRYRPLQPWWPLLEPLSGVKAEQAA
jgi:hypothetical protein